MPQNEEMMAEGTESRNEEKQGNVKDCHSVVKSSGMNKHRNHCCEHRGGAKRLSRRVHVACQTDDSVWTASTSVQATTAVVPGSPKKDGDKSSCEGTLRLMIQNFQNMTDTVRGPGKVIAGVPWKIMVMPRQHVVAKKGQQKCLGFFLQCCPESYSDSWSCQASAELRLISQKPSVPNFVRKTNHNYTAKENDWGYSCFMTWNDILDENQGYMKDEKVILEVSVKSDYPKGILTYEAFKKKIEDYMRLVEVQSGRGFIDKAIEVNQTALKFCKDKDEETKELLEKQKLTLIELKLQQSIARIEKGSTTGGEGTEDSGANLNKIRQALTGGPPKKSNKAQNPRKPRETTKNQAPPANGQAEETNKKKAEDLPSSDEDDLTDEEEDEHDRDYEEEPCCSDEGEEDEDVDGAEADDDECCDECLQEKLEHMSIHNQQPPTAADEKAAEMVEMSVQTDPVTTGVTLTAVTGRAARTRAQPVVQPVTKNLQHNYEQFTSELADLANSVGAKNGPEIQALMETYKRAEEEKRGDGVVSKWDKEKEAKILEMITEESRNSIDQLRTTIEDLVRLAQEGEVPVGLERGLECLRADQHQRAAQLNTDIVQLPDTPPPPPHATDEERKTDQVQEQRVKQRAVGQTEMMSGGSDRQTTVLSTDKTLRTAALNAQLSPEEYSLIAHAKEIVETKAEELVHKYSQLIEQSEATRLAETVKKVEKRMKDIEKQTMTCRKELSEECTRHSKEEAKLIKAQKQIKVQLEQSQDKIEKLNVQLREKKAELKKMEKKLKQESQTSVEKAELVAKVEALEKELETTKRRHAEESRRLQRESQSFIEARKTLQQDLNTASSEIERLTSQLEDKDQAKRKADSRADHEKRSAHKAIRDMEDRAKKAEVNLLEFKLDISVKSLQRTQEECAQQVRHWEGLLKRVAELGPQEQPPGSETALVQLIKDWSRTRERVQDLVHKTKSEFGSQIESVKSGKHLAALPVLEVPKPPPQPQTPHALTNLKLLLDQPKQAPIGTIGAPRAGGVASGAQAQSAHAGQAPPHQTAQQSVQQQHAGQQQQMSSSGVPLTNGPTGVAVGRGGRFADSGSSPSQGGGGDAGAPFASSRPASDPSSAGPHADATRGAGGDGMRTPPLEAPVQNGLGGAGSFSPWDPLGSFSINEALFNRHNAPGGWDSWSQPGGAVGSGGASLGVGGLPTQSQQQQQQHPSSPYGHQTHASQHQHASQQQQQMAQRGVPQQHPQQQQNGVMSQHAQPPPGAAQPHYQGQWGVGWGFQQVVNPHGTSPSPGPHQQQGQVMDSRGSSPSVQRNDSNTGGGGGQQRTRTDALLDQLTATFPRIPPDHLREYVMEWRNSLPGGTMKGFSVEDAVNSVVGLILNKNTNMAMGVWTVPGAGGDAGSGGRMTLPSTLDAFPPHLNQPPPPLPPGASLHHPGVPPPPHGVHQQQQHQQQQNHVNNNNGMHHQPPVGVGVGNELCLCCHAPLVPNKATMTLKCKHRFHSKCAKDWVAKNQSCPYCRKYNPSPDEYPELS